MRSQWLLQVLLPTAVLPGLNQQLTGVLTDPDSCCSVHGIGVFNGDDIVQLIDLLLDLPAGTLLSSELLAD